MAVLYRAIDKQGQIVDVHLSDRRNANAARTLFQQAIDASGVIPTRVTTDNAKRYPKALHTLLPRVEHRSSKEPQQRARTGSPAPERPVLSTCLIRLRFPAWITYVASTATTEQSTNPGRIASNTAALGVAWHTFSTFLEQQGHWRTERVRAWLSVCQDHLSRLALAQGTLVMEERASLVFLQAVRSLLASGRAVLHNLDGGTPDLTPSQVLIGGVDRTGTYLMTPTTYDLVCEYKRRAGQVVPWSQRALVQMLEQDGLLVSTDSDGRHKAVLHPINGQRVRCWHLPVHVFGDR